MIRLLSSFAFNVNLRRYIQDKQAGSVPAVADVDADPDVVPLESAGGVPLTEQVRTAMAATGVHHVCEVRP
jgi:hypothetical protein